ncbi:carbohydrate kinase [Spirochaetia bacterium]|nr:carbohydrate kinase [Spirochaetia bacterium]
MEYAIAVIDIGMTNKKVAVYDDTLRQLDAQYHNFEPEIVDGLQCHDLEAMEEWFLACLGEAGKKYPVKAIAVSTHGATFVCLGRDGKPALPCVYYTHEPVSASDASPPVSGAGKDFHRRFYERFGPAAELQARTGTPAFEAMINPAKGIFFAQEQFPQAFKNVSLILPYPQYWGFRLTGKAGVESTYMGCHSYLWDQVDHCLSSVARDLGIAPLLPDNLNRSWDVMGTISEEAAQKTGLSPDTIVTMGIHDSNASLLPHFAQKGESGFVLNSTGTWCVMMNPVKEYGFVPDELGKVVFFNISAFGTPVKTAIFLGGQEFETWSKILMTRHQREDFPPYDEGRYRNILQKADCFLMPELVAGSGQFPGSKPRVTEGGKTWFYEDIAYAVEGHEGAGLPPCFNDYEQGFAVLRISLVMQSLVALERTGLKPGQEIFTEGGFRKNEAYNRLLSSAFRDNKVYLTSIAEASALGAAMTAKMALSGKSLGELAGDFEVDYQEVQKSDIPELFSYRKAWMEQVEKK